MKSEPTALEIIEMASAAVEAKKARSAWDRGVKLYALELLEDLETGTREGYTNLTDLADRHNLKKALLNGATSWNEFSWGGSSLIYNCDIARRLCAPWELRKTHDGERDPNPREQWLDVQARALYQACYLVTSTIKTQLFKGGVLK